MELLESNHPFLKFRRMAATLIALVFLPVLAHVIVPATALAAEVRLGIIMDVPRNDRSQALLELMVDEMRKTLGSSHALRLDEADILSTDWNFDRTMDHYRALCGQCDVIVLLGSGAIQEVVSDGAFCRPTLGLGVFEPELQGIPFQEIGVSGQENFSYVLTSSNIAAELKLFQGLVHFENLTLLLDRGFASPTGDTAKGVRMLEDLLQAQVNVQILTDDVQASIESLPAATDAVYVWAPYGMETAKWETLAASLNDRRLPSFSVNRSGVDAGLMASLAADNEVSQALRKLAVMVDDVVRGESLAQMPVAVTHRQQLYMNSGTMRRLEFSPPFEMLFTADFTGPSPTESSTIYGVRTLVETALAQNLDLKISELDVALADQEQSTARSQYLPSFNLSSSYSAVNEEQTNAMLGRSERTLRGSVQLQQLLFSESANANIRIQSHLRQAEEAAQEQVALGVVLDVFDAYFDVLRLKTNVAIQRENLDASRKNLELAQVRVSLGSSNRADLFRWESEVAVATQDVIDAHLQLLVGKKALNNLLGGVPGDEFDVVDEGIDGELYRQMSASLIAGQLSDPVRLRHLTEFLIEEAQRSNPSKHLLEANVLAVERRHDLNKRRFYLPTLSVGASLDNTFDRSGAGSEPPPGSSFNDDSWSANLTLSLPLFEGNRRRIDLQTTRLQRRQLEYQRDDLDQRLSLAVSSAATDLMAASTNIGFSRVSAENTAKNFELLQDNYRQGTVSILDVLDAQTVALNAKQGYAVSVYDYMTALMKLENLIGEYSLLATTESDRELRQRFDAFIAEREGQK